MACFPESQGAPTSSTPHHPTSTQCAQLKCLWAIQHCRPHGRFYALLTGHAKKHAPVPKEALLDAGLAYEQELGPEHSLVHPQNRGGTGINAFNCHSKGAVICSTGADLSQLAGSVAFETNPKTKQKQVSFTASLAKESDGLLANPTGMERFLTVSKGHTSQFCKAIKFNCRTPQASLAGGDGCLGNHLLARDSALATMVNKGWKWTIILACVEETFPQLPSLVESACNSSNATYEAQNEVQLMSAIIAHNISLKQGDKIDFVKVASDLCHGGPLKSYAGAVGRYVQLLAGWLYMYLETCTCCMCYLHSTD